MIGARDLGGKIDYIKLRAALEEQALKPFGDCWFFDQNPSAQRLNPGLTAEYNTLKLAAPDGPQFQVSLFPMKKYNCHCRKCGNHFTQNVQKGVDNGIATKILSLAYENICERFILFAGDGDFYSSLNHVRNVLRKDIWVIGYRGTVSGDLQQLASRMIWMNDLWVQVKTIRQVRPREQGRRNEGRRNEARKEKEEGERKEDCNDEVRWFEDHEGEDFQLNNDSSPPLGEDEEVGNGRQVVLAQSATETSSHPGRSTRNRGRAREGRGNGKGRAKRGRGRSRSRSRDRPRAAQPNNEEAAIPSAVSDVVSAKRSAPVAVAKKKKRSSEGKRGAGGRSSKKRKRNEVSERTESNERRKSKRGGRGDNRADEDKVLVFTLSDVSSDDEANKPFPLALPMLRRPNAAAPVMPATPVMTVPERDAGVDEIGSRTQVIDLASDTESE